MLKQSFTLSVMLQAHETVVYTVSKQLFTLLLQAHTVVYTASNVAVKQSFTLSVMLQAHVETVVYNVSNVADTH